MVRGSGGHEGSALPRHQLFVCKTHLELPVVRTFREPLGAVVGRTDRSDCGLPAWTYYGWNPSHCLEVLQACADFLLGPRRLAGYAGGYGACQAKGDSKGGPLVGES